MSPYRPPPLDNYNSLPRNMPPPYGGGGSSGGGSRRRHQGSRHGHGHGYSQRSPHASHGLNPISPTSPSVIVNPFGSPDAFIKGSNEQSHPLSAEAESVERLPLNRPISAFVGGIDSRIDDDWIKKILEKFGGLRKWRRALDIDDKPLSFGFCEFEDIKGAACAMRVLSSGGDSKNKGLALPSTSTGAGPVPLTFRVDNGLLRACESINGQKDQNGSDAQTDDSAIRESLEQIINELGAYLKDHADSVSDKDQAEKNGGSEVGDEGTDYRRRRPSKAGSDRNSKTGSLANDVGSGAETDSSEEKQLFSLEDEEKWEQAQAKRHRHERLVLAAEDYGYRLANEQAERENRIERNALRELDRMEDRQRARDVMAEILSRWDDSREESLREHEYYRDRERWWHHRKASRAKEIALDKEDREREEREKDDQNRQTRADTAIDACSRRHSTSKDAVTALSSSESEQHTKGTPAASTKSTTVPDSVSIPTDAAELFKWPIKWEFVDDALVQNAIESATRKRLTEYLGAESDDGSIDDLAEFVIGHISEHKPPEELAQELEMVLVEESPVFVAYIWRVLVQETERQAHLA